MSAASADSTTTPSILRSLWIRVYVPSFVFSTGQGAVIAVLALSARNVGASTALAGIVVAVYGLGTMAFDVPSGWLVAHFGETRAGRISTGIITVGLFGALFSRNATILAISVFVMGGGWGTWLLVRLTHVSRVAPLEMRGRGLSLLGGVQRAGNVVGPFIIVAISGPHAARASFLVFLVCCAFGFTWLIAVREADHRETSERSHAHVRPIRIIKENPREFATAGTATMVISLLRASRLVVVPLWGAHIGLGAGTISLIFALSSILDLSLFYPSGFLSDRFGRKAVALPCLLLLSIGHMLIPAAHSFSALLLVALVLGAGNGFGSGIVMTLGADRAPKVGRTAFLAVWRLISDMGTTAGPLVDAAIIATGSLALASSSIGVIGLGGAGVVAFWLEDPHQIETSIIAGNVT